MSDSKNAKAGKNSASKKDKSAVAATKTKKNNNLKVAESKESTELKKVESKKVDKKAKEAKNPLDKLLWLLAFVLIVVAIGGNYYYTQYMMVEESSLVRLGRVALVLVLILAGLGTVLFTTRGKKLIAFMRESYTELRKVVWPTRQEGMQTTLIVFIAVVIVSLFLYVFDLLFLEIVRVITV